MQTLREVGEPSLLRDESVAAASIAPTPAACNFENDFELLHFDSSMSSLQSVEIVPVYLTIDKPLSLKPPGIFEKTGCTSKLRFSLKGLETGIAKGGSILVSRISPATRQENELASLLLGKSNGKERKRSKITGESVSSELGVKGVFEKHASDIAKLLESRFDSENDNQHSAIKQFQTAGVANAVTKINSNPYEKATKPGAKRTSLRVIEQRLKSKVKVLAGQNEWHEFEEKIGNIAANL
jgi:hypothetical protein